MAERKPLVLIGSTIRQLPTGDTVEGATGPTGPQGPAGPTGPTGPQGPAGSSGPLIEIELSTSNPTPVADTLILFAKADRGVRSMAPFMTDSAAPSGAASANESYVNNPAWKGFAAPGNGWGWASNGSAPPHWLKYQFPSATTISAYSVAPWDYDVFPQRCFKDFTLQGSNDDTNWTTLDTQTGITSWLYGTKKTFTLPAPVTYVYFRIHITANAGGDTYTGTRHVEFLADSVQLFSIAPDGLVQVIV